MEMRILTAENQLPAAVDHMNSSNSSTPYMSAASSPRRPRSQLDFFFYSAPTSPRSYNHSMAADLYDDYSAEDVALLKHDHSAAVPFDWELKPGVAKGICNNEGDDQQQKKMQVLENEKEEFEFDFSGQLDRMVRPSLSSADELFDGGKIRPLKLKPPPSLQINNNNNNNDSRINSENHSPRSPKSAMSKFKDALSVSPRHRRKGSDEDPFEAAIHSSRKSDSAAAVAAVNDNNSVQDRGRSKFKTTANTNTNKRVSNNNRKGISRSLSPLRVSEFALLHHQQLQEHQNNSNENSSNNSTRVLGRGTNTSSKKWSLKDLFLFRSASEGHYKDTQSFSKRWSAKSSTTVSPGSGSGSGSGFVSESGSVSKRRGQGASAHEMHYTTNKAVSEEMKKKTSLPYKHGLLACLGFSPILPQFSYTFPSSSSTTLS